MNIIRHKLSTCPVCCEEREATIRIRDGKVFLSRTCPEHGECDFLLSAHGDLYGDLDRFVCAGPEVKRVAVQK